MSYVPVIIDPAPGSNFSDAFGIPETRYDEIMEVISKKLDDLSGPITKSGMCKLFVDEATTDAEAIMLSFMAGAFLMSQGSRM